MSHKILITGASKGIGLAIARIFYQQDFEVIICARGQEGLTAAKAEMPNIHTYTCDLSDKKEVKLLGQTILKEFGTLDVLVNNGGVFLPGLIHQEEDEIYETQMRTNIDSAYYLSKILLPPMIEKQSGTVFNICSVASLKAYPNGGSYCISKFALLGFSKMLREELKPYNIRVVSVLPGAVRTASWDGTTLPDERFIPVEDVGKVVWNTYQLSERTVVEDIVIRPALGDI